MYPLKNGSHNALALAGVNGSGNWNRLMPLRGFCSGKASRRGWQDAFFMG